MKIYEPVYDELSRESLVNILPAIIQKMFPAARFLSHPKGERAICQFILVEHTLVEIQIHSQELEEESFEWFLNSAARLEGKRKELNDANIQDIALCVFANGFSSHLLSRMSFGLIRVSLHEFSFIRSEGENAVFIRRVKEEREANAGFSAALYPRPINSKTESGIRESDLSTPELIAFARLGMELRKRRAILNESKIEKAV
ncbi:MAG: hypothetical protein A3G33_11505 [Omnitrophica bacterium RIFCSPLOWO2_12_FULL_44_17]|uniref:Uncharacterized protein n=1 Tax=Candidatus Danuiimicrobium aquiferis TaxID=1801832 RepID=A0A1G1KS20_9BACT|nr:MAG: hypothetical protein A3B72_09345 [Omnitrophica bacterium RIFCSPHIGHO2_02_FULL_45_28]OGW91214.1 MAG: hypothetical protein A3E74_02875 [Omnitrophica bacterium RIFCSPHIGHO2_12_FULL_44_12]OGW95615.1 MAG: hypothetical protein A3G33_11505 [Omnitrophica bacterium RIFCSPLOWO2_12_FULL_44_17]OGX03672.1 MAG: hypothetical protein A3J12_00990 [Omnitrophica bacterium RIFCSPLOWO2_02_FULL_44_11]